MGSWLPRLLALLLSLTAFALCAWYALEADPTVVMSIELDRKTPGLSNAQVYWSRRGPMREEDSSRFETYPGVGTYSVRVPVDARALRIDPLETPGVVQLWRIVLQTHGVPIKQWGGDRGFAGWVPVNELVKVEVRAGALSMESIGRDPWLEYRGLEDLRPARRTIHLWVSLAVGLVGAGLNAGLTWIALRPRRAAPRPPAMAP